MKYHNDIKISEIKISDNSLTKQKVRLYKIKHFIFDFGGVLIEKTFVLKNLLELLEHDLRIKIPKIEETPYLRKLKRRLSSGIFSSEEFLVKVLNKYYYPFQTDYGA
ncbi:MAG: hypothetical protein ACXACC_03705 [Promethearchaeota archaeon]|jgi:hypothetical protein